jgi:RNA polymerase sigma factor (sigma-70 family)
VTDAEVISRSQEDPTAFREIFVQYHSSVLGYARRRVGWEVGEEVAAQTFLEAFTHRSRFDMRFDSAKPWLMAIATNLIRHHLRDEHTHIAALLKIPKDVPPEPVDDPAALDAERMGPALAQALLSLNDQDRETFLLVALAELTYRETASALDVPIGTIRSRISRAKAALREHLGQEMAIDMWEEGSNDDG